MIDYPYDAQPKDDVRACNLCGSTHHVEVSRRDRYGFAAPFRVCARCGLGFISPRMTAPAYASFYDGVYRPLVSAYHGRLIDAETVQDEQREYAAELVAFLQRHLTSVKDILDVGGSTGVVGGAVGDAFGATVTVLDPAPAELAVAESRGYETVAGFAEDFDPHGRRWDLVLLCQTIDHLLDVRATVDAIGRLAGRYAFVDVLDVEFMARRRGSIEGAVKIDHPYYLTRSTALAYFDLAGLSVVAERLSDDGHLGFLLAPGAAREPEFGDEAQRLLRVFWELRA